ncbi:glycoside hydrolase family 61 protein [Stemphylium lycopersici]|nr:glycoside hydrolase family 61 protein [Stemphylium lycopersici]
MKTQSMLLAALASAPAALAHTVFTDFFVDGVPQGDGVAMRMNPDAKHASSPIGSLGSTDMACNVGGTKGVSRVQPVKDGALLTFEIRSWPNDPSKERLDRGHKGPCAVYLKKVDNAATDKAAGDGWFKIFDHGYDDSTDRWCTDEIIDNDGLFSVNLPKGLEGGDYLARPEILALHAANDNDPQFYTGCAQIFLESTGNLVPESTVSIPGYVDYGQPSTDFNIYNNPGSEYVVPGPKIAALTPGGASKASTASQTDGLKPEGCIMENANWCGKEVSSYSTEKGCWASATECWDQSDVCFNTSPPTGNANCKLWQKKCEGINAECTAMNFNGPPNKGKVLTPVKKNIDVGLVMATEGAGAAASSPKTSSTEKQDSNAKATPTPAAPKENGGYKTKTAAAPEPTVDNQYESPPFIESTGAAHPPYGKFTTLHIKPVSTITVGPSSADAPAPTAPVCPEGYKCVTVTDVEVVTEVVYVTATAGVGGYKKRAAVFPRRHLQRA